MDYKNEFFNKRTKIVATLGPASNKKEVLRKMILAGMNVVRLNFSHGNHESHAKNIKTIRGLAQEMACPIAVIGDLRGPHIRVGDVEKGGITLKEKQPFILTPEICQGNAEQVTVSFPKLAQDLKRNDLLLLDDGSIHLKVTKLYYDNRIETEVIRGGILSSRRGINAPNIHISLPALTQKDLEDIDFAIEHDLDFLALSFVQSANDIKTLKTILAAKGSNIAVIAKIEMSEAVNDIEGIVKESDAVMVARGDMALEMSFREVPIAQKRIIATCRRDGVPVITATQMLESMIKTNKPTRAEVTDVANAVFDGTDALMLSAETAIGDYPAETIATMSRIAVRAEHAWRNDEVPRLPELRPDPVVSEIISYSGATAAEYINAAAIVTYTRSGSTARWISRFRPKSPIIVLTPSTKICNQMALNWGVHPVLIDNLINTEVLTETAIHYAVDLGLAKPSDYIIITSGNPSGPPGNTNLIAIEMVP